MWEWLEGLKGGAPAFVGAMTGSLLGLVSLVLGALFNAHLNRKRDDQIRRADKASVAAALGSELTSIRDSLVGNAERLEKDAKSDFFVPDISQSVRLLPELKAKIGLLDAEAISAVMKAFALIDEYGVKLVLMRGSVVPNLPANRMLIAMPAARSETDIPGCAEHAVGCAGARAGRYPDNALSEFREGG